MPYLFTLGAIYQGRPKKARGDLVNADRVMGTGKYGPLPNVYQSSFYDGYLGWVWLRVVTSVVI